ARTRDVGALKRRHPPDHDRPRHEDRAAVVRAADRAGRDAVRRRQARLQVPGAARPDAEPLLAELRAGARPLILVTGGTGFVGPRVVHALRSRDLPVPPPPPRPPPPHT